MINSKKSREELLKELYELKIENESLKAAFKEDIAGRNSIINDIANKEYIKKALESEKQRLSVILKGTNAGTWEWNIQTGETIFNERWAEILGYSLEEISPVNIDTWIKFVHPEDLKISNDLLNLHFIGELDYYECEARMKHKSGNWVWVMDRGRVHSWDIEGKPLLMSGTHQDITSRKNAEVALQKSQYLYTLITDNISDVIWMMDLDGKFIYISPSITKLSGFSMDEVMNLPFTDFYTPSSQQIILQSIAKYKELFEQNASVINSKEVLQLEGICKDGSIKLIEIRASILFSEPEQKYIFVGITTDITERKKAEEKLLETNKKFEAIISASPDGIGIISLDGKIQLLSDKLIAMHGYTNDEHETLTGKSISDFIDSSYHKILTENILKLLSGETFGNLTEYLAINKEGKRFNVDINSTVMLDSNGKPSSILFVERDITERKRAEEALKQSETKLRAVIEHSHEAIGVHVNGIWKMCNPAALKLFGVKSSDELIGSSILNVIAINERNRIKEFVANRKDATESPSEYHTLGLRSDGTEFDMDVTLSSFILENILHVFVILRDITASKHADDLLRQSEQKFNKAFHSSPVAMTLSSVKDGIYLDVNDEFLRFAERTRDEVIGRTAYELNLWDNTDERRRIISKLSESGFVRNLEQEFKTKSGCRKQVLMSAEEVSVENEKYHLIIAQDITERKHAEEEQKILLDELKESKLIIEENLHQKTSLIEKLSKSERQLIEIITQKDKFFSIIAHDLRGPFNGFLGLTKVMAEEIQTLSISELRDFSRSMQNSAANLYQLLENLLEWSRIQRGLIEFYPEEISLSLIVNRNIDLLIDIAHRKDIDIITNFDDDTIVIADLQMLNTIIRNLISNAIKFSFKSRKIELGTINLPIESLSSYNCIYVKDYGIGMNTETIAKLFKIDEKVKRSGTEGELSTGLGLLLCKEFIDKHGGRIWAESEVGIGSTFYFTIKKAK